MEVLQAGEKVFSFANKRAQNAQDMLNNTNFETDPTKAILLNHEIQMMGALWQLAASLMKDLTEPLKSIVNK